MTPTTGVPRRAIVTGSARGIGRAIVETLAASGHEVVGVDVLDQSAESLVAAVQADLADPAVAARLLADHGPFDILVNNAALFIHKPLPEFSLDDFDRTIAVNLRATFLLSQAAAPVMAERGWGRIVNLSSVGARTGGISQSAVYNATKAAIISLTKNFARNYGAAGVTANAIAPGAVETFMTSHIIPEYRERYLEQIPVGRYSEPAEIADLVDFLVSDRAAYINGATVDINGGWVMT